MNPIGLIAVVGLVLLGLGAAYHAARCGWVYLSVLAEVLNGPNPGSAASRSPAAYGGSEPAYQQYLFGPELSDLRLTLSRIRTELEAEFHASSSAIWSRWWTAGRWQRAIGLIRIYGLVLGTVIGTLAVVVVTVVQIVFAAGLAGAALAGILLLRALDGAWVWVRGIRMTCPGCYRRIGYPAYRCPSCGALHRDVRPGRYGVLRRRCLCDQQELPTLLMFGSHRLTAFCPHPDCEVQLADASGTTTELLLPIVGGQNVGKTRLLTVIVKVLQDSAAEGGFGFAFADQTSSRRIGRLQPAVLAGEATRPTPPEQPRAYSLYLTRPKTRPKTRPPSGSRPRSRTTVSARFGQRETRRLIHLFDTAGEKFYESDVLAQLRYLGPSRTFLFVIDPLSIDQVWTKLDALTQDRLRAVSARRSPEFVFQQVLDNVERMAVDPKRARLAVALSKADLLIPAGITGPDPDSAAIEQWLDDVGLDNLVRTMRHAFGEVRFFHTSAMVSGDGTAEGVAELVEWLLAGPVPRRLPTARTVASRASTGGRSAPAQPDRD
jgi:hypothetical protein